MTLKALCALIAAATLIQPAQASPCAYRPEIRAAVTVRGCVAVTLGATDLQFVPGPEFLGHLTTEHWSMYHTGDTLSGTLVTASVKSAKFVWTDGPVPDTSGMHLWRKGESRTLFVQRAPAEVCPKVVPSVIEIQTEHICYDMYHDLVPDTIYTAKIIAAKTNQ
jgi:hypothetical protein